MAICTEHISLNSTSFEESQERGSAIVYLTAKGLDVQRDVIPKLLDNWDAVYDLNEDEFEELVLDRLLYSGMQAIRTGRANRKDGGVDIIFWTGGALPILGAVQVKHHRTANKNTDVGVIREMVGVLGLHRFNAAFVVTNTDFTDDARVEAQKSRPPIQLRDARDLKQWIEDVFSLEKWHSQSSVLELCKGVSIQVPQFF